MVTFYTSDIFENKQYLEVCAFFIYNIQILYTILDISVQTLIMKGNSMVNNIYFFLGDALNYYDNWASPTVIISDGPYGINGYKGDLKTPDKLGEWYEPHIEKWSKLSTPITTLWFWSTEIGWANVHPVLQKHGWDYVSCCIWNKGLSHVAGNVNTKTIRRLPVVTEVCVQYSKKAFFKTPEGELSMKDWLRYEWGRTGLPISKTNEACGVKNAATRKYFTKDWLWYMPPANVYKKLCSYANEYGDPLQRPFFTLDGKKSITSNEWEKMRSKFYCPLGVTNVWSTNQLRDSERIKENQKAIHLNQKPLELISRTIEMTSDINDVVWDPFAGLGTTAVACHNLQRTCYCAEIDTKTYNAALKRIKEL